MRNLIVALVLASATPAAAQQRDILEGQPAVRHRRDLRAGRFELGPMFGFTLLEPYKHSILAGLKADYHIWDWLSVGALGMFGVASLDTGLTGELAATEQAQLDSECGTANPSQECLSRFETADEDGVRWEKAHNSLKFAAGLRATVTPIAGKLALFSSLFCPFDLYVFGGAAILGFKNDATVDTPTCGATECDGDLGNDGISPGFHLGLGFHLFFADFVAFNFEFIDNLASNNPTGRNTNESSGANVVDGDDKRFGNNMMLVLGATFYFPTEAPRTK